MPAEKIERFRAMLAQNPDNELACYSLASALFEDRHYAEAEQHFADALQRKPDWVLACILRARCLIQLGRADEARPLLEQGREHSIRQGHRAPVEEIDEILQDLPP